MFPVRFRAGADVQREIQRSGVMAFADLCRRLAAVGRTKTRRSPREAGRERIEIRRWKHEHGAYRISCTNVFGIYACQCHRSGMACLANGAIHMDESAKRSKIYKQISRNEKAIGVRYA